MGFKQDTIDDINGLTKQLHNLAKHVRNNTEDCERLDDAVGNLDHTIQCLDKTVADRLDGLDALLTATRTYAIGLSERLDELDERISELEDPDRPITAAEAQHTMYGADATGRPYFHTDWLDRAIANEIIDALAADPDPEPLTPQHGDIWIQTGKNCEPICRRVHDVTFHPAGVSVIARTDNVIYTQYVGNFVDTHTLVWRDGKRWDGS